MNEQEIDYTDWLNRFCNRLVLKGVSFEDAAEVARNAEYDPSESPEDAADEEYESWQRISS